MPDHVQCYRHAWIGCTHLYILNEHNEILLMLIQSLHLGSYWLPVSKGAKDKIKRRERPPDRSLGAPRPLVREYWLIFCNFAASFCLSDSPGKRGPDNSPGGEAFLISVFIPILVFTTGDHIGHQVGRETERSESEANEVSGLVHSIGERRCHNQISPFVTTVKDHHKHHQNGH